MADFFPIGFVNGAAFSFVLASLLCFLVGAALAQKKPNDATVFVIIGNILLIFASFGITWCMGAQIGDSDRVLRILWFPGVWIVTAIACLITIRRKWMEIR